MSAPELSTRTDRELMRLHCQGDPNAFGEIFARHRNRMYAVAVRTLGGRDLAADCVQEAFISAFRRADAYRGDAAVTTWLHRIVVNACLDRIRREKHVLRRVGDLAELDQPDPSDAHSGTELRILLREALDSLPEGQRLAVVLVDMEGMPLAEVAQVLEVAEGTVKSRCSRGRAALAQALAARGYHHLLTQEGT